MRMFNFISSNWYFYNNMKLIIYLCVQATFLNQSSPIFKLCYLPRLVQIQGNLALTPYHTLWFSISLGIYILLQVKQSEEYNYLLKLVEHVCNPHHINKLFLNKLLIPSYTIHLDPYYRIFLHQLIFYCFFGQPSLPSIIYVLELYLLSLFSTQQFLKK